MRTELIEKAYAYEIILRLRQSYFKAHRGTRFIFFLFIKHCDPLKGVSSLGHAYAAAGHTDKALECLEKLKQREKAEPGVILHMDYAFLYSGRQKFDQAFYHFHKAYEQRMGIACLGMIFCVRYPLLKELKLDPRFKELTGKMGMDR